MEFLLYLTLVDHVDAFKTMPSKRCLQNDAFKTICREKAQMQIRGSSDV